LKSLPCSKRFLHPEVTAEDLERIASEHSDTKYAKIVQQRKLKLFRSFARSITLPT
jgi:hypothetical protein